MDWRKNRKDERFNLKKFGAVVGDVLNENNKQLKAFKLRSNVGALHTNAQLEQLAITDRTPKTLGINNTTKYDKITNDYNSEMKDMFTLFDTYDADRTNFTEMTKLKTLLQKYIWDKSAELQLRLFLLKQKESEILKKKIDNIRGRNLGRPIREEDVYIKSMFRLFDLYSRQLLTEQNQYEKLSKFVNEYINADPNHENGLNLRNFLIIYDKDGAYAHAISVMKTTDVYFDPNITIKKKLHTYLSDLYRDFEILKESLNEIRIIIDPNSSEIKKSKDDVKIDETFSYSNFVECMNTKTFDFLFILKLNLENLVEKIEGSDKLKIDKKKEEITNKMLENVIKIEKILEKFKLSNQLEKETYDKLIGDYKPVIFNTLLNMQSYFTLIDYFIQKAYETKNIFNENNVKILVTNMTNLQIFIEKNLLIHRDLIKRDGSLVFHPTLSYFIQSTEEDPTLLKGGRRNPTKKPVAKKPTKKPTKLNRGADMNMKDIRGLCKVNQIKLSKTKDGVRVIYTKKELITKLKRKKIL